ncbi:helix-turn-helix domain-containing protein [Enterococcus sp. CWB-B31]|uniref:helix-turn-helix domain-containing protein n=1 Tax=Enterococcus sp. CWB-B31 TaxID=2885159 RepID=UPI001E36E363|nr:helix-turn-helix transcriptional regulator [Enterococcus sp. CWB-B31]MCB5956205.1 helix-turn-helix domain-containing protein [Enterococcus sp. CWB-B31]
MKQLGTLLKKIREDKGLSQQDICGKFISRAALSRIENNKSNPKYKTLEYLLEKLSISFGEFEFLQQGRISKNEIISQFWRISDNTQVNKLEKVIDFCNYYLVDIYDKYVEDIRTVCEILISLPDLANESLTEIDKERIVPIWERLNQMNQWTLSELRLASSILFFYRAEIAINIAARIEHEIKKYETYTNIKPVILSEYINLTTLYMNTSNLELAAQLNDKSLELSKQLNRFDYYYLCYVRKGIFENDISRVSHGKIMLKELGKENYIKFLDNEIQKKTQLNDIFIK